MVAINQTWYAYPNITDSDGLIGFFNYVSVATGGMFFPAILGAIWFVAFVATFSVGGANRPAAARAFTFASFFVAILSILLAILDFVAPKWMYLTFILVGVGVLWIKLDTPTFD